MLDYRRIQRLANRTTVDAWTNYEMHREKTMLRIREAVGEAGLSSGCLLVVGAGNANDLDLAELADAASELWLVDIDEVALSAACSGVNRGLEHKTGILPEKVKAWIGDAGGQITSIDAFLADLDRSPLELIPALSALAQALRDGKTVLPPPGQECMDVVVSQCVLSQILWPVTEKVWEISGMPWSEGQGRLFAKDAVFPFSLLGAVLRQLAVSHLVWLERLVRPGGVMLINSDIVWRGVPLYGASPLTSLRDPELCLQNFFNLKWDNVQEWNWPIEESVQAVVQSVLIKKTGEPPGSSLQFQSGA